MQPKTLAEFYEKVFGRKPDMADDGEGYGWQVGSSFFGIMKHSEINGKSKEPARILFNFETSEIQEEFKRISGFGAKVIKEPYEMGGNMWIATFEDPDGNLFQLMTPWEE